MTITSISSYPNSRTKPRSAATEGETVRAQVPSNPPSAALTDGGVVTANGNVELFAADSNRTDIELRNTSTTDSIAFSNIDDPNIDTNTARVGGFVLRPLESINLPVPTLALYARALGAVNLEVHMVVGRG